MALRSIKTPSRLYHSLRKQQRIRIKQTPHRPLQLNKRDLVKWNEFKEDAWWFVLHRRGVRRAKIGVDPLEARATPRTQVKGTLPERIVHRFLIANMRMVEDVDFSFQSSQDGGRLELGGMVVDFLFGLTRLIIQVQGPTHGGFRRHRKDEEQTSALELMGFTVVEIGLDIIYNVYWFENFMRRLFGLAQGGGAGSGVAFGPYGDDVSIDWTAVYEQALGLQADLEKIWV